VSDDRAAAPRPLARPVLVVEADRELGKAIAGQLDADGYRVQLAQTAEHARILARAASPRLVVLGDIASPRGSLDLLEEIRASRSHVEESWDRALPVIVLDPKARVLDMLRAFDAGADDVLVGPTRYLELRARLRAVLRRSECALARQTLMRVGPLAIDTRTHTVSLYGRVVPLRRMEFDLLLHLAAEPERVFTKDELLRAVWGYHSTMATRTLDSHASRLRRKLGADESMRWVINVWGVGYRLI
jgi:DNA-binding response OmpR family regulator